jgi:hypothetical protein
MWTPERGVHLIQSGGRWPGSGIITADEQAIGASMPGVGGTAPASREPRPDRSGAGKRRRRRRAADKPETKHRRHAMLAPMGGVFNHRLRRRLRRMCAAPRTSLPRPGREWARTPSRRSRGSATWPTASCGRGPRWPDAPCHNRSASVKYRLAAGDPPGQSRHSRAADRRRDRARTLRGDCRITFDQST